MKSKKEPITKNKRNPKYWKFDPDEELKKPVEEKKTEKEVNKKKQILENRCAYRRYKNNK